MRLRSWLPTSGKVLAGLVIVVVFALVAHGEDGDGGVVIDFKQGDVA